MAMKKIFTIFLAFILSIKRPFLIFVRVVIFFVFLAVAGMIFTAGLSILLKIIFIAVLIPAWYFLSPKLYSVFELIFKRGEELYQQPKK
jgi:hypothetical protein